MANDIFEISMLLDFYGQLLTASQYKCMDLHYNNDMSLAEIAEELSISRQGVHDFINRGKATLVDLESKLGMVSKFRDMKKQLEQLQDDLHLMDLDPNDKGNQFLLERIDQSLFNIITKL
ncbi:MAG: YlxM family DNA-binding protein [Clostridia bacterium]|nr:YlxM family DNA-binding protein [Clostridia bacterium]